MCADAVSSKLGMLYSEGEYNQTYLLLSWRKVPKGKLSKCLAH